MIHPSPEKLRQLTTMKRDSVNLTKEGRRYAVNVISSVFRDGEGNPRGIVTAADDVTERKAIGAEKADQMGHDLAAIRRRDEDTKKKFNQQASMLALERGLGACEKGEADKGLLLMAESLRAAT